MVGTQVWLAGDLVRRDGNGKETRKWIFELSESVTIHLGVETGRIHENKYLRYPNPFPCVSDPFPSLLVRMRGRGCLAGGLREG